MDIQKYNEKSILKSINQVSELDLWINNFNSKQSIETYSNGIRDFFSFLNLKDFEEVKVINHGHVIAYKKFLQEKGSAPRSINNRLSAISSLFNHLINEQIVKINPSLGVKRMKINSERVEAKVLTALQVRAMLDIPDTTSKQGLRDKAILHILFFTGCRVSELCNLKVKDYFEEQGFFMLDFVIKGGKRNRVPINQELQIILNRYLIASEHKNIRDSYLILPVKNNNSAFSLDRRMSRWAINDLWAKYALMCGIKDSSPHSARATFITESLENKCPIENVQNTVGHSQIKTTQMYDKRVKKYKDSASFAVRY